jgi:hypothetical protein
MTGFYLGSMLLTVLSNVGYHLCQRSISDKVNPLLSLALTYVVALTATLIAFPFFRGSEALSLGEQVRTANWATYALGFALVGLELGFLLVYRAGWKVSVAALTSNALVTILLIPVGLMAFNEQLGFKKVLGILLASAGLWLLKGA